MSIKQHIPAILFQSISEAPPAYLVGGAARDALLGRPPSDYDIAVAEAPRKFATMLAEKTGGTLVEMGKSGQDLFRVVTARHVFDISEISGPDLRADLSRRDFTINALAYSLTTGELTDCTEGLRDLREKKVRMVSAAAFLNDPIRLLRAFRLASTLGFEITPRTLSAIQYHAARIRYTAGERTKAELFKTFGTHGAHPHLIQMATTGLLSEIFPELLPSKGCLQNRHHEFDVLEHSFRAFYHLETLLANGLPPETDISEDQKGLLKCCILLHDMGKPFCGTTDPDGSVHFYGHDRKGAEMAQAIAARLKFSNRETRFITFIVGHHMHPLSLFKDRKKQKLFPMDLTRFFMQCGPHTLPLLIHALADNLGKKDVADEALNAFIRDLMRIFLSEFQPRQALPPLVTGDDLIREFDIRPSPLFKKLLNCAEEERLTGTITTRHEALRLVRRLLNGLPSGGKVTSPNPPTQPER